MSKKRRRKKVHSFIWLSRRLLLKDENWRGLSPAAKLLYIYLKSKFNGSNNGQIKLHYSELQTIRGFKNPNVIASAFKELEAKEWINRRKVGGLYRYQNEYKLTGKYDELLHT